MNGTGIGLTEVAARPKASAVVLHTITASAGANGSIDPTGATVVAHAGTQAFAFTPATGYHVASVTVDGSSVSTSSPYTFTNVTADHTIAVAFELIPETLVRTPKGAWNFDGPNTPGGVSSGSFTVPAGATLVLGIQINGDVGAAIAGVTFAGASVGSPIISRQHTYGDVGLLAYRYYCASGATGTVDISFADEPMGTLQLIAVCWSGVQNVAPDKIAVDEGSEEIPDSGSTGVLSQAHEAAIGLCARGIQGPFPAPAWGDPMTAGQHVVGQSQAGDFALDEGFSIQNSTAAIGAVNNGGNDEFVIACITLKASS
jgi:hypothetical protein